MMSLRIPAQRFLSVRPPEPHLQRKHREAATAVIQQSATFIWIHEHSGLGCMPAETVTYTPMSIASRHRTHLSGVASQSVDNSPDTPSSGVGHLSLLQVFLVDVSSSAGLGDKLLRLVRRCLSIIGRGRQALGRQRRNKGIQRVDQGSRRRSCSRVCCQTLHNLAEIAFTHTCTRCSAPRRQQ